MWLRLHRQSVSTALPLPIQTRKSCRVDRSTPETEFRNQQAAEHDLGRSSAVCTFPVAHSPVTTPLKYRNYVKLTNMCHMSLQTRFFPGSLKKSKSTSENFCDSWCFGMTLPHESHAVHTKISSCQPQNQNLKFFGTF